MVLTSGVIDLNHLLNYANQPIPSYIQKDNTPANNGITDAGATLGRVLFYDKLLSVDLSISCASCHLQAFAFGDTAIVSAGVGGSLTDRHTMRLVNARFSAEPHFFWNERAASLEDQVTKPIREHDEMGYSGLNGRPSFDVLLIKMKSTSYYPALFNLAFGDANITETRMEKALAQFVRSMQSFDSRYDQGRACVSTDLEDFPNFTAVENEGKRLFLTPLTAGGAACFRCHAAPEFSIDPATLNNGVVGVIGQPNELDLLNTRAPSLRDLRNPQGKFNGPFMHTGEFKNLNEVLNHYNYLQDNPLNTNLDPRLNGPQNDLTISKAQKEAVISFLLTLTGDDIYKNEKWSDPFDANGNIDIVPFTTGFIEPNSAITWNIYPNPAQDKVIIHIESGNYQVKIYNATGQLIGSQTIQEDTAFDLSQLEKGIYTFVLLDSTSTQKSVRKVVKQ